jgi:hypothetical protein
VKRHSLVLVAGLFLAASSGGAAQQSSESDAVTPRISRLEQWFSAIASHRPGAVDEQVRLVNTWIQEEFEMLGNGPEARQSYERAATLAPMVAVSALWAEPPRRAGRGPGGRPRRGDSRVGVATE